MSTKTLIIHGEEDPLIKVNNAYRVLFQFAVTNGMHLVAWLVPQLSTQIKYTEIVLTVLKSPQKFLF